MPKKKNQLTDDDFAILEELGEQFEVKKAAQYTKEEERVIAGFEEIQRFFEEHGRSPQHGEGKDIFERLYAVRLDRLNELGSCHELLQPMDHQGLLNTNVGTSGSKPEDEMDDDALLKALGVEAESGSIEELKYVRSDKEREAAEKIANRERCENFDEYKKLFNQVKEDLQSGTRQIIRCEDKTTVEQGDLYITDGQMSYIAKTADVFINNDGREDCRLKVIFDNGTESKMLRRSFQKILWKDDTARRITNPSDMGPLFSSTVSEEDVASGTIYILRSNSTNEYIKKNRQIIHKIGFTTGSVENRISDASNDPTYLLADVEVVKTFTLYNLNANKLENLFHKLFSSAKLEIEIMDRFGKPYKPQEWFMVTLPTIQKAVQLLIDGKLSDYVYEVESAQLRKIN